MDKFVNPETIAKMQSDIKKKAGLNTNNTFKGNNDFEKAPTINGEAIATITPNGTNYLMVYGVGTPTENAAELQAVYNAAKLMLPTVNNRITVVVAPGTYDFGATAFVVDTPYINIVSLTGNSDVIISSTEMDSSGMFTYGIKVTANNILIKGINCKSNTFYIADNLNNLICEYCIGGETSFGGNRSSNEQDPYFYSNSVSGTFNNCTGGSNSFGSNYSNVSGTFNNCIGGDSSFGVYNSNVSGTFNNCIGGSNSFGSNYSNVSGTFNNCTGGAAAFGGQGRFEGKMFNCNVVSTEGPAGDYWIEMNGLVQNCSFSHGILNATGVGKIINCITSDGSIYNSVNVAIPDGVSAGDAVNKRQLDTKAVINNTELLGSTSIQKLAIGIGNINPSGTISSITNGVVTGNGTKFTTEFYAGAKIYFPSVSSGAPQTISSITDDSTLIIANTSASVPPDSSYSGDLEQALNVGYVILEFADNAAAVTGGLANGYIYRTADVLKVVHA